MTTAMPAPSPTTTPTTYDHALALALAHDLRPRPRPTPTPTPTATAMPATMPTPTATQAAFEVEWRERSGIPVPDGAPDWTYDSMNGFFLGSSGYPLLDLWLVALTIDVRNCGASMDVVGGLSAVEYEGEPLTFTPTTIRITGPFLTLWEQDNPGADYWTEAPYLQRAVVTIAAYDAVARALGQPEFANAYTAELNPVQAAAIAKCLAG